MQFQPFVMLIPSKMSSSISCRVDRRYTPTKVELSSLQECVRASKAGTGNGHCLINETAEEVVYLEVGDRRPGDEGSYPDDDLKALLVEGKWKFVHKDGTPYV